MKKSTRLLMGLTLGLSMGYGCIPNTWSMTEFKFHSILQANGLIKTTDIYDLTRQQAGTYVGYLASIYQKTHSKDALSSLRILGSVKKFKDLQPKIKIMVTTLSGKNLATPRQIVSSIKKATAPNSTTKARQYPGTATPAHTPTKKSTTGANPVGSTQPPAITLNIDYFYGVLRANKLLPNTQIPSLSDEELKTYIEYLLLKRKYDSTNQAVIDSLKTILRMPRYKQFIGSKDEIFLYSQKPNSANDGKLHFGGVTDQMFYSFLQKGDIIDIKLIKKLNSEQLDIYIDYLKLRYKLYRIEDGDQMDNERTTSAEKYLHMVLLIRARKQTIH